MLLPRTSLLVLKFEKVNIALSTPLTHTDRASMSDTRIGELVFGVARIFASFNDTFVHVTDLRFVHAT